MKINSYYGSFWDKGITDRFTMNLSIKLNERIKAYGMMYKPLIFSTGLSGAGLLGAISNSKSITNINGMYAYIRKADDENHHTGRDMEIYCKKLIPGTIFFPVFIDDSIVTGDTLIYSYNKLLEYLEPTSSQYQNVVNPLRIKEKENIIPLVKDVCFFNVGIKTTFSLEGNTLYQEL
jgi:hypothetical protein